jgi:WD40 repeat protein
MIGFVVGRLNLEQMESSVDGIGESDALGEQMESADAAIADGVNAVGDFVVDVGGGEDGAIAAHGFGFVESSLDSALVSTEPLSYLDVHSKFLSACGDEVWPLHSTPQKQQGISSFSKFLSTKAAAFAWLRISWKADGKLLVSCGADHVLKLWDAESGSYLRTMKGGVYGNGHYKREVAAAAFIGDSEEILAASGDGSVRLHRASSDNVIMSFTGAKGYQYAIADGQTLLAAGSDGVLRLWFGRDPRMKQSWTP